MSVWQHIADSIFGGNQNLGANIIISTDSAAVAGNLQSLLFVVSTTSLYRCTAASATAATWSAI